MQATAQLRLGGEKHWPAMDPVGTPWTRGMWGMDGEKEGNGEKGGRGEVGRGTGEGTGGK